MKQNLFNTICHLNMLNLVGPRPQRLRGDLRDGGGVQRPAVRHAVVRVVGVLGPLREGQQKEVNINAFKLIFINIYTYDLS